MDVGYMKYNFFIILYYIILYYIILYYIILYYIILYYIILYYKTEATRSVTSVLNWLRCHTQLIMFVRTW